MLNLRQLNKTDNADTTSDAQHFSRFSIDFRVPSDLLGNIGEPLDHSRSERLPEDAPDEHELAAEESETSADAGLESAEPASEPSGARWKDRDRAPVGTAGAVAGPSMTRWDDEERANVEGAVPGAGASKTQNSEVGDALHASGYMGDADTRIDNLTQEVRFASLLILMYPQAEYTLRRCWRLVPGITLNAWPNLAMLYDMDDLPCSVI